MSAYDDLISKWASFYKVPEALVKATIAVESNFRASAYNASDPQGGAHGLMQILNGTAAWVAKLFGISYGGSQDLYDEETNIRIGTAYLKYQLTRYNGNVADAAAAYNAGSVRTKNGQYINQSYVDKVMAKFKEFSGNAFSFEPSVVDGTGSPSGSTPGGESGFGTLEYVFFSGVAVVALLLVRRIL